MKLLIFTCVYNGENYIDRLFDSMISQTSKNFIHYIYDDGSADNTSDKIQKYIESVKKLDQPYDVIYERNKINKGSLKSTQHCLEKINDFKECSFFTWINADDWINENYVEFFLRYINKNKNYDIFFVPTTSVVADQNNNLIIKHNKLYKKDSNGNKLSNFLQNYVSYYHFIASINFFIENKMSLVLEPKSKCYYNDIQIIFLYAVYNANFKYINKNLHFLLKRKGSISYGNFFDVYSSEGLASLESSLKLLNNKLNIGELQDNISVFEKIKRQQNINRREILKLIKKYFKYKKNHKEIYCKLLFKFRILCFLISPKLSRKIYLNFSH